MNPQGKKNPAGGIEWTHIFGPATLTRQQRRQIKSRLERNCRLLDPVLRTEGGRLPKKSLYFSAFPNLQHLLATGPKANPEDFIKAEG